eukprot:4402670-Alexandrium_andersonii.AAC.1
MAAICPAIGGSGARRFKPAVQLSDPSLRGAAVGLRSGPDFCCESRSVIRIRPRAQREHDPQWRPS